MNDTEAAAGEEQKAAVAIEEATSRKYAGTRDEEIRLKEAEARRRSCPAGDLSKIGTCLVTQRCRRGAQPLRGSIFLNDDTIAPRLTYSGNQAL